MKTTTETLWKIYDSINDWIRFSDTKAGVILATNGVIGGAVLSNPTDLKDFLYNHPVFFIPFLAGIFTECISIYFSLRCLNPTLKIDKSTSLVYFAHIAQKFNSPAEYEQVANKTFLDDKQASTQVAQQVWANSKVAWKKYEATTWSIRFLALTALISLIGVLMAVII